MSFDDALKEILKHQIKGYKGQINPTDDFAIFICDIKSLIAKYAKRKKFEPGGMIPVDNIKNAKIEVKAYMKGANDYRTELFEELGITEGMV